ncbi:MAG: hypothetical protein NTZ59_02450 [Bacteroidetes bacterium]|nr:hypothetical protein [Bacteroidota bacterium]
MSERQNKLFLFIGQRGSGKTTHANNVANAFIKSHIANKIIVVDTDAHPFYNDFDVVDIESLKNVRSKKIRCEDADDSDLFLTLNTYQRNAFVIFEDAAKYVSSNISNALKKCIIDMRKRNFDLAFMFHSLSDVPPYIAKNYNAMVLFKTLDNFNIRQDKFFNWYQIKEAGEEIRKSKSKFDYTIIQM